MKPQLRVLDNHSSAIELLFFLFLIVFFDSYAGISLLGEVNWILAWLITRGDVRGAAIEGFGSCWSEAESCVSSFHQIDRYLHLTEDRASRCHHQLCTTNYKRHIEVPRWSSFTWGHTMQDRKSAKVGSTNLFTGANCKKKNNNKEKGQYEIYTLINQQAYISSNTALFSRKF